MSSFKEHIQSIIEHKDAILDSWSGEHRSRLTSVWRWC